MPLNPDLDPAMTLFALVIVLGSIVWSLYKWERRTTAWAKVNSAGPADDPAKISGLIDALLIDADLIFEISPSLERCLPRATSDDLRSLSDRHHAYLRSFLNPRTALQSPRLAACIVTAFGTMGHLAVLPEILRLAGDMSSVDQGELHEGDMWDLQVAVRECRRILEGLRDKERLRMVLVRPCGGTEVGAQLLLRSVSAGPVAPAETYLRPHSSESG